MVYMAHILTLGIMLASKCDERSVYRPRDERNFNLLLIDRQSTNIAHFIRHNCFRISCWILKRSVTEISSIYNYSLFIVIDFRGKGHMYLNLIPTIYIMLLAAALKGHVHL